MSDLAIVGVVEGQGETEAIPLLIRNVAAALGHPAISSPQPVFLPRTKVERPGNLERAIHFATLRARPRGAILVVMDADDDCVAELAGASVSARVPRPGNSLSRS